MRTGSVWRESDQRWPRPPSIWDQRKGNVAEPSDEERKKKSQFTGALQRHRVSRVLPAEDFPARGAWTLGREVWDKQVHSVGPGSPGVLVLQLPDREDSAQGQTLAGWVRVFKALPTALGTQRMRLEVRRGKE